MGFNDYQELIFDASQLSRGYHAIYMIIVFCGMLSTGILWSSAFPVELVCRTLHTLGVCNEMLSRTFEVLLDQMASDGPW